MSLQPRSSPGFNPVLLNAARGFLLLALAGAGYLAFISLSGGAVAGCGPEGGCNQVLSSRWAYWLGIPTSLPAMGVYLGLLFATSAGEKIWTTADHPWRRLATMALSGLIFLAAGWFMWLQYGVLKHWCKFCLATHASGMIAAALLMRLTFQSEGGGPGKLWRGIWAGALGCAILIGGQLAVRTPLYSVTTGAGRGAAAGLISLEGGKFKLKPNELPSFGSISATNYIVSLFDYTCAHCRRLHPLLKAAVGASTGRISVISLPVPLDAACNPVVVHTPPASQQACEYARLGLAVWRARAEAFVEFDDWMLETNPLPPLDQARAKAETLAGKQALEEALRDPWVERQLRMDIDLYIASSVPTNDGRLPQLIFGDVTVRGPVDTMDQLTRLMEQHAALHRGE